MDSRRFELERLEERRLLSVDLGGNLGNPPLPAGVGDMVQFNGAIYFGAGRSVMKFNPADGSSAAVKTFRGAGQYQSYSLDGAGFATDARPADLTAAGGTLFFTADDGVHGRALWKSDGTAAGTVMVKDINPGSGGSVPDELVAVGNKVVLAATSDGNTFGIWSSDGTAAGTKQIGSRLSDNFMSAGDRAYFEANARLYQTDGTSAGTKKIADLTGYESIKSLAGSLYLFEPNPNANGGVATVQRVNEDGSMTTLLSSGVGYEWSAAALGSKVFFTAATGARGSELWMTDGTVAGTSLLKDINPGRGSSFDSQLTASDNLVYFKTDISGRKQLWRTDGTAAGTVALLTTRNSSFFIGDAMLPVGKLLYFNFTNLGLWVSDGTAAGTKLWNQGGWIGSSAVAIDSHTVYYPDRANLVQFRNGVATELPVAAPTTTLFAPPMVAAGQKSYVFTATFTSQIGLPLIGMNGWTPDHTSLYIDTPFTVIGPSGGEWVGNWISDDRAGNAAVDGAIRTSIYSIPAPKGGWTAAYAGTYKIIESPTVEDLPGNVGAVRTLGTFQIQAATSLTVTITGAVFNDVDQDGTRDASEPGLGGYQVFIDSTPNGRLDAGEATAVTDRKGRYTFSGLAAGAYRVRIADAKGKAETSRLVTVTARPGTTAYADLGVGPAGTIHGKVFHDVNANGVADSGDSGTGGLLVWSDYNGNNEPDDFEPQATTASDGSYVLTVPTGPNAVMVMLPNNQRLTLRPPRESDVAAGANVVVNMGWNEHAYIHTSFAFSTPVNDPAVTLYLDLNNNGALDTGEPSRSGPNYNFDNLTSGTYELRIKMTNPDWAVTRGGGGYRISVTAGTGVARSFTIQQLTVLSGTVFNDLDEDGGHDDDEPGVAGATVFLDSNQNGVLDADEVRQVTASDGLYKFFVRPGEYHVVEIPKAGWTEPGSTDADVVVSGYDQTFTNDFDNDGWATLNGECFVDANGDHKFNEADGDEYAADAGVYVDLNNNGQWDIGEPESGGVIYLRVQPGTWHVRAEYGPGLISPIDGVVMTVVAGEVKNGVDFEFAG